MEPQAATPSLPSRRLVVLLPAFNEGRQINETITSLRRQTHLADQLIVVADNCTDDTSDQAKRLNVEVYPTIGNIYKKAGALNQWLDKNLETLEDHDLVMVMDADSSLEEHFFERALGYIDQGYSAVGGVFQGKPGGGFVGALQRNEYARYARDVARKRGKTLVLTGTATVFVVGALKEVVKTRASGELPNAASEPHVYDTGALTEDNELTFALLHLHRKIIAPAECMLTTEVMSTWIQLWRQRLRWKRGAIENNLQYGLTRVTLKYWGLQVWGFVGIVVTALYLATLTYAIATNSLRWQLVWIIVTAVYSVERMVTVRSRKGWQILLAGLLVVEMPYDFFLQATHVKAFLDVVQRSKKDW